MIARLAVLTLMLTGSISAYAQTDLVVNLVDCDDQTVGIYKFNGLAMQPLADIPELEAGMFRTQIEAAAPQMYYLGTSPQQTIPVIVGGDPVVKVNGSCAALQQALVYESSLNTAYQQMKQQLDNWLRQSNTANTLLRRADSSQRGDLLQQLADIDAQRLGLLDSLRAAEPFLARIAALNTYLSFEHHGRKAFPLGEFDYFQRVFFKYVDHQDPGYEELPWVYQSFRTYTSTLLGVRPSQSRLFKILEREIKQWPAGSSAQFFAGQGALAALKQQRHSAYLPLAEMMLGLFQEDYPQLMAGLVQEIENIRQFMKGGQAPDFAGQTPTGDTIRLSDLRGKIVLVDFWASWCGPCRRENPRVAQLYKAYKDKGFEILGVSIDRDANKWQQAIEADGLEWPQIIDDRSSNAIAKLYSVTSIPHTMLLDAEGKIIERGLRGRSLEEKLAELFPDN